MTWKMSSTTLRRYALPYLRTLKYVIPLHMAHTIHQQPEKLVFSDSRLAGQLATVYLNGCIGFGLGVIYPIAVPMQVIGRLYYP